MTKKRSPKKDRPFNSYEERQVERAETSKNPIARPILRLKARIAKDPKRFKVYSVLRILVIITMIREIFTDNYENAALCVLSLFLFLLPAFFEENMHITISSGFEIVIYLFIYAAEVLGEINDYYTAIPGWDTMLHTINGFLCAAVGFSLVDILNQRNAVKRLSAGYLALVAFCFSMTIGVCWEIIEFTMDYFFLLDMQKDYIVTRIGTVTLDPTHSQVPVVINNITKTVIYTASGKTVTIEGGYLDIGIIDTMKDLIVNLIGALTFSIIGYKTIQRREKRQKVGNIQNALTEGLRVRREEPAGDGTETADSEVKQNPAADAEKEAAGGAEQKDGGEV